MIKTTLMVCSLMLVGCDALNCIVNNHPEFSKNSVSNATLNQVFEDSISVSISNSFEDGEYYFSFKVEGDLPPGLSYETTTRKITFTGTPTELGDFPFQLSVVATPRPLNLYEDPLDGPEDLCSDTESRNMVFSVVQGF